MQERLHMSKHPGTNPEPFMTTVAGIEDQYLVLTESYCYPRGGGQPGDTGKFEYNGGVYNFGEVLGGEFIRHPVSSPEEFAIGEQVECEIDPEGQLPDGEYSVIDALARLGPERVRELISPAHSWTRGI